MATDTIHWFNATRRFDPIAHGIGGADVLLHHSSIEDTDHPEFTEDQRVDYEIALGPKQLQDSTVHPA
jgi:CspA family cold shock protein